MDIEIITTGNELMSGLTLDTNFRWAADRLTYLGFHLRYHTTTGDDEEAIINSFNIAEKRSKAVLVSGGLGPTPDDLTAEVASKYFGVPLELNDSALEMLERIFRERGRELLEINKKQAYLPKGSRILENFWGTAPGFRFDKGEVVFFFLPGVPKEFRSMIEEYVIPELDRKSKARKRHKAILIKTFGLRESEVAERLKGFQSTGIEIGYRSHFPEIHLRVTVKAKNQAVANRLLEETKDEIVRRLDYYVFSTSGEMLEEVVGKLLRQKKMTISIAESCTGGLVAHRITNIPGSSDYFERGIVTYSNRSKEKMLRISKHLIETKGAVSAEVVECMAEGVRKLANTDLGIGISGIAGPGGGTVEKPVGTVFIGISDKSKGTFSKRFKFRGSREEVKLISSEAALDWIRKFILNDV